MGVAVVVTMVLMRRRAVYRNLRYSSRYQCHGSPAHRKDAYDIISVSGRKPVCAMPRRGHKTGCVRRPRMLSERLEDPLNPWKNKVFDRSRTPSRENTL